MFCLYVCLCIMRCVQSLWRSEECARSHGAASTDICEPSCIVLGIEPRFSRRAVSSFNCTSISSGRREWVFNLEIRMTVELLDSNSLSFGDVRDNGTQDKMEDGKTRCLRCSHSWKITDRAQSCPTHCCGCYSSHYTVSAFLHITSIWTVVIKSPKLLTIYFPIGERIMCFLNPPQMLTNNTTLKMEQGHIKWWPNKWMNDATVIAALTREILYSGVRKMMVHLIYSEK